MRVENEKEKRLEELHEKYDKEVEEHKRETQEKRKALNNELDKVSKIYTLKIPFLKLISETFQIQTKFQLAQEMRQIDVIEGKSFETVGKYEPALISSLTETVIHSNLFYHPPPTMTEK